MKLPFAVIVLLFAACLTVRAGEVTIANLGEALHLLDSATTAEMCSTLVDESPARNSVQLFYSAAVCAKEERSADASFLLLAGQIRSSADMQLYQPASNADRETMATLYGLIFYQFGGAGDQSIYRDAAQYTALVARLSAWDPSRPESYNPGWNFKSPPREIEYKQAIAAAKEFRLTQLASYSRLVRDDLYYAANEEFSELQSRNPRGFISDTEDYDRSAELMKIMRHRERELTGENLSP